MGVKISEFTVGNITGSDEIPFIRSSNPTMNYRAPISSLSASLVPNTASYSLTASHLPPNTYNITASNAVSSSYSVTSSYSVRTTNAITSDTASFLPSGTYEITASKSVSASYALTASTSATASYVISSSYSPTAGGTSDVQVLNQSNYRIVTTTGTTDVLSGSSNLTFNGDSLVNGVSGGKIFANVFSASNGVTDSSGVGFYGTSSAALTSSFVLTSSYSPTSSFATTSSYSTTSSFATTSSFVTGNTITSTFVVSASLGSGAVINTAHGLGGLPTHVQGFLKCLTTEFNYSVDDYVELYSAGYSSYAPVTSIGFNTTNVFALMESANIYLHDKSTGARTSAITPSSWSIVVKASRTQ